MTRHDGEIGNVRDHAAAESPRVMFIDPDQPDDVLADDEAVWILPNGWVRVYRHPQLRGHGTATPIRSYSPSVVASVLGEQRG